VLINGTPGEQLLPELLLSCALSNPRFSIPISFLYLHVSGSIASGYLVPTFGVHRVLSPKTTLTMPPRRSSQRLHVDDGLPQTFDQNQIPFQHPPNQALPTITEAIEHPTFNNIPEIQLQHDNMSTTAADSDQNGGGTSSTQTNGGAPH
jgi:hypothetical protein